ncbi:MAG: enoyl-CoA hydratase/isomerase family protein [Pseudonocardia sp.]|nr:enoyl-CoA hydratase/isomerase family protein [Pseudonocardia sp.]
MDGVQVRDEGPVRRITLNRPRTRNALTREDLRDLRDAFDLGPAVRAVVLDAAGDRAFCAGMNVDVFLALGSEAEARAFIDGLRALLRTVRTAPVTTICAIDGYCLGAAFELALACDLRVATTRASFGLPEIKLGVPSVVDAALLQQYVGLSLAKEIILTGDTYPVARLAGICTAVVEPGELGPRTEELVGKVAGHTRTVLASQKRLFETWQNTGLADGARASVEEFATTFAARETREQLASYRAGLGGRR